MGVGGRMEGETVGVAVETDGRGAVVANAKERNHPDANTALQHSTSGHMPISLFRLR